jgi:hypothetical protein
LAWAAVMPQVSSVNLVISGGCPAAKPLASFLSLYNNFRRIQPSSHFLLIEFFISSASRGIASRNAARQSIKDLSNQRGGYFPNIP